MVRSISLKLLVLELEIESKKACWNVNSILVIQKEKIPIH